MTRARAAAAGASALAVAAAAAVVLTNVGGDPEGTGARAATPSRAGTVAVARRTLVDRQRVDGTLGYSGKRAATNRLTGTITWLPHTGAVVRAGQALFKVDGKPVVLMDGTLPAYRTLKAGIDDGDDVLQLERGLSALGYYPGTVDDHYDSATAAAVRAWQDDNGLTKTGRVELGRVVFLPGSRRVTDVKVSLGSTNGSGGGGNDTPSGSSDPSGKDNPSGNSDPSAADDGDSNAPATDVLSTTSTRRVVTAKVDAADQTLVAKGQRVRVELPDGRIVPGRIVSVGTVASADSSGNDDPGGGDSSPTITTTIRLRSARAAGRLDQAPVSVQIARTTRRHVLAVPAQALVARRGGRYAVERADGRLVNVTPGVFANGYVELVDGAIHVGDRVRVPR
jgi:peptidoglycan hydrolase-like protein with peptidoglycan-binding domain